MELKSSWRLFIGCYRSYFLLFNLLFFILSLHYLFFLKNFVGLAIFLAHHFMRLHFLFIIFCGFLPHLEVLQSFEDFARAFCWDLMWSKVQMSMSKWKGHLNHQLNYDYAVKWCFKKGRFVKPLMQRNLE